MIVKKVPTKKGAAAKSRAVHARDLCDYIAGAAAGDGEEKVEHRGAVNLLNIDHAAQVQEMADLAEVARRSPQPVQHWILSWRQGEYPSAAEADEAVRMLLGELGLAEHQCIYALHRNTDNYHLHLAVNRVHPETERVVTVNGGFDIEVAHRAIARIEHAQGWQHEASARYRLLDNGELTRTERPMGAERQPTTPARDFENRTGQRSAQRIALEEGAAALRRARTWHDLHSLLSERGMRLEKKGSGAILWVGDVAVKASVAGRDCSLAALQKRLGAFVPGRDRTGPRLRSAEPIEPAMSSWTKYTSERDAHSVMRKQEGKQLRMQHREQWAEAIERHRTERWEILDGDWRGRGAALNALRSMLAARQAQEKAALRERNQAELSAWRKRFPSVPRFEDWLRQRESPELAQRWRFRDRTPAGIAGDRFEPARPRDIRAFVGEVQGSEVHYRRQGAPSGWPSFIDRGGEIRIRDLGRDSVLAALQLSAQKWGTFQVYGSESYKRLCVEIAAECGLKISNPELQAAIAARREERSRPRHAVDLQTRPTSPSPANLPTFQRGRKRGPQRGL